MPVAFGAQKAYMFAKLNKKENNMLFFCLLL